MKLTTLPKMSVLRKQARRALKEGRPDTWRPISSEVELSALNLLEQFARKHPNLAVSQSSEKADLPKLGGDYADALTKNLATLSGHSLAPAMWSALKDVRWNSLELNGPTKTLLGTVADHSVANAATAPKTSMNWDVEISGHWNESQLENVQNAVEKLGERTGTKALRLLRSVHLRTHLGEVKGTPILGLTSRPGPISLRRDQADHGPTTEWLVFHEVGHQLDRFLSGSSKRFRSHDSDTPFGRSNSPEDYVDGNQVGSPEEDFADCHALALYHYEEIQENPDLYLHSRGEIGKKMAWILKEGYGVELPEPSEEHKALLAEIDKGHSSYENRADFYAKTNANLLS